MLTVFAASQLETDDQDDGLASSQGYQLIGLHRSGDTGTPDGQMLPLVDLAVHFGLIFDTFRLCAARVGVSLLFGRVSALNWTHWVDP